MLETEKDYKDFLENLKFSSEVTGRVLKPENLDLTHDRFLLNPDFIFHFSGYGEECFIVSPQSLLYDIEYMRRDEIYDFDIEVNIDNYIHYEFTKIIEQNLKNLNKDLTSFQENVKKEIENKLEGEDDIVNFYSESVSINGVNTQAKWKDDGKDVKEELFEHMDEEEYEDNSTPRFKKAADMIWWYNIIERNK